MVNFDVTKKEMKIITKIAKRAQQMAIDGDTPAPALLDIEMDITATHCNGNPLRLADLAMADDTNFCHDVFGILRNIDRTTGKLKNFFLPRFSV